MAENGRRDFMGKVFGGWAALGGIAALYAAKKTWDPLPSVKAAGFTKVDLSAAEPNVLNVEKWRGKPIFILKKTEDMPKSDRDVVVGKDRFLVCIGLCTHLGCIPAYRPDSKDFLCACHGGMFDTNGDAIKPPPPSPMVIPPFKLEGTTIVLGEEGPEYKKMKEAGLTA
ncbi:Rieske 2Fe-2S domain-containing protein [Hydrogenimonas sp.]|uniref:Rieske 2Fe-2S domain-containing protein n=1 Tax=Hydrogenimonas sp. TaxID=2231112 RepID=UPI00260CCBC3|nr:Rieske 2Fe-2S domain-containing protein [Hydrogenimonas sp.]